MAEARCGQCGSEFAYDEETGLNMKRFEPESNNRYVFIGGVMPCCPSCGARYHPPRVSTEIQVKRVWLPMKPKALIE